MTSEELSEEFKKNPLSNGVIVIVADINLPDVKLYTGTMDQISVHDLGCTLGGMTQMLAEFSKTCMDCVGATDRRLAASGFQHGLSVGFIDKDAGK